MNQPNVTQRIDRAQELLKTAQNAAMATVNEDGSPHNTPYFFMYDEMLTHVFWGSHPDSQHSQNVARTGQVFIVLYEANQGGGLYIQADQGHATEGVELETALVVHNSFRAKFGKDPLPLSYYQIGPQCMYMATIRKLWVNAAERDTDGKVIQDLRHEITTQNLF